MARPQLRGVPERGRPGGGALVCAGGRRDASPGRRGTDVGLSRRMAAWPGVQHPHRDGAGAGTDDVVGFVRAWSLPGPRARVPRVACNGDGAQRAHRQAREEAVPFFLAGRRGHASGGRAGRRPFLAGDDRDTYGAQSPPCTSPHAARAACGRGAGVAGRRLRAPGRPLGHWARGGGRGRAEGCDRNRAGCSGRSRAGEAGARGEGAANGPGGQLSLF